ncbi:MAG: protein-S-isoprenylcysteine O-methyltransferase [Pseudomonadota bacterium]
MSNASPSEPSGQISPWRPLRDLLIRVAIVTILSALAHWRDALTLGFALFLIFTAVWTTIRARYEAAPLPVVHTERAGREARLVKGVGIGMFALPCIAIGTPLLDFASYPVPVGVALAGALLALPTLWLFWRSHADLGRNWSPVLELREGHGLVTHGVYARVRHPMYAAIFAMTLVQFVFLGNWLAGPAGYVAFLLLYLDRIGPEEEMMAKTFGEDWVRYTERTGALFPNLTRGAQNAPT